MSYTSENVDVLALMNVMMTLYAGVPETSEAELCGMQRLYVGMLKSIADDPADYKRLHRAVLKRAKAMYARAGHLVNEEGHA